MTLGGLAGVAGLGASLVVTLVWGATGGRLWTKAVRIGGLWRTYRRRVPWQAWTLERTEITEAPDAPPRLPWSLLG